MRRNMRSDPKKRHSMLMAPSTLDITGISSFAAFSGLYNSKSGNKSADDVATSKAEPTAQRGSGKPKNTSLKRSTVLLDDNMVREYNLAIQELAQENGSRSSPSSRKTPHRIHHSSVSASSSMSSLFSRESTMSIQDLMYQELSPESAGQTTYHQKGFFTGTMELELVDWEDEEFSGKPSRTQLDFF
ncbi:LADA_0H06436g1_1 [Lachancea dasiensis]|uniref:LADA_0H06436g1_1 n=1 Tax=Lachancea dasiensis TaxID=1072105 RepID=A0A1G4K1Q0_9SACH|nr:LADA_0H06436g1_1 [Lachancea dasiensis]